MKPLFAVLDETGTTNRPQLSEESDFAVAVVLFEPSQQQELARLSQKIGNAVGKTDYKYKHVQRSNEGRRLFIEAVNMLQQPGGVFGLYAPGASLLKEKLRAIDEMAFLGVDDGGVTAATAERIRNEQGNAHIESFLGYFASCIVPYAASVQRHVQLHWDRRTDLGDLQDFCDAHNRYFRSHPQFGDVSQIVSFKHDALDELTAIVRLAGALAGDVRYFYQKHGEKIWGRLPAAVRFSGTPSEADLDPERFLERTLVAKMSEPIADPSYDLGAKDTCILQGYCRKFISEMVSFLSPDGKMGHLVISNVSNWTIHQIPD